jgi:hypothetical protein
VHSNTVPQADAGRRLSLIVGSDGLGLGPHSASAVVSAAENEQHEAEDETASRQAIRLNDERPGAQLRRSRDGVPRF